VGMFHVFVHAFFSCPSLKQRKIIILAAAAAAVALVVVVVVMIRLHLPVLNLLGAFAKLRKACVSFAMSVCLSVRLEQLPLDGFPYLILEDFYENLWRKFKFD
jgi:hypothetical protein